MQNTLKGSLECLIKRPNLTLIQVLYFVGTQADPAAFGALASGIFSQRATATNPQLFLGKAISSASIIIFAPISIVALMVDD